MLTTGLLGASSTTSAPASASSTPAAGLADSAPTKTNRRAGSFAAVAYPPFLEVDGPLARRPTSTTTWVSIRSSVAGSSRMPGCQRAQSAAVTAESG